VRACVHLVTDYALDIRPIRPALQLDRPSQNSMGPMTCLQQLVRTSASREAVSDGRQGRAMEALRGSECRAHSLGLVAFVALRASVHRPAIGLCYFSTPKITLRRPIHPAEARYPGFR